ncbi:hypothetical protein FBU59_000103 [Linderina macrospora]|uniref:Uncharacterized protein n=1 Tax=Linderina macrospora TaxID=4868 RepID=A0ACC1JHY2_9FUNG|nr:hypothetical protein FBU59_000103 [Linderina macrospora]
MKHRPQLSSQLSQSSSISIASNASRPKMLDNRSRSQSLTSREPIIVMSDDIRPGLIRQLNAEQEKHKREQERLSQNMAAIAASAQRRSARNNRDGGARSGRRAGNGGGNNGHRMRASEYSTYVTAMRAAGQSNLEEFLIQEAIRMSLAEVQEGGNIEETPANADQQEQPQEQPQVEDEEVEVETPDQSGDADIDTVDTQENVTEQPAATPESSQNDNIESSQTTLADTVAPAPAPVALSFDAAELDAIASIHSRRSIMRHSRAQTNPTNTLNDLQSIASEQQASSPHLRPLNTNPFLTSAALNNDDADQINFPSLTPQPVSPPLSPRRVGGAFDSSRSSSSPGSPTSPVPSLGRARRRPPPPPPPPSSNAARARARSASRGSPLANQIDDKSMVTSSQSPPPPVVPRRQADTQQPLISL